jgi:hypothetical protein
MCRHTPTHNPQPLALVTFEGVVVCLGRGLVSAGTWFSSGESAISPFGLMPISRFSNFSVFFLGFLELEMKISIFFKKKVGTLKVIPLRRTPPIFGYVRGGVTPPHFCRVNPRNLPVDEVGRTVDEGSVP